MSALVEIVVALVITLALSVAVVVGVFALWSRAARRGNIDCPPSARGGDDDCENDLSELDRAIVDTTHWTDAQYEEWAAMFFEERDEFSYVDHSDAHDPE